MPRKEMTPRELRDNLNLIDRNIRNQHRGSLVAWHCELCERNIYHPERPTPQCPHCSTKGVVTRLKRYYGGLTIITGG